MTHSGRKRVFNSRSAAAPSLGGDLRPVDPHNTEDIESVLSGSASEATGGLIVPSSRRVCIAR